MEVWLPETQSDHGIFSDNKDNNKSSTDDDYDDDDDDYDDDDEAVARMIQQEFEDAASRQYASSLERQQKQQQKQLQRGKRQDKRQREHRVRVQQRQAANVVPSKTPFLQRKWARVAIWTIIAVTILLVTATLLFVFGVFGILSDGDEPFWDGWIGGSANVTVVTRNDGTSIAVPRPGPDALGWVTRNENDNANANANATTTGLRLDVLNACDDTWQSVVRQAIANWGNGSPIDSLTLTVSVVEYEFECAAVEGKLKICNGNHGPTLWRGLSEILLNPFLNNTIFAATSKLNDHYLYDANDHQKLYTSCHELGHGFGLPHWDEDFYNLASGNCMDYTHNPGASSSKPDESNFLYLAQLYGGRVVGTDLEITADEATAIVSGITADVDGEYNSDDDHDDDKTRPDNLGGRSLRLRTGHQTERYNHNHNHNTNHNHNEDAAITNNSKQTRTKIGDIAMSIPLSESRLRFDHTLPGPKTTQGRQRRRRILHADEYSEIHTYECDELFPGCMVRQHFLLA